MVLRKRQRNPGRRAQYTLRNLSDLGAISRASVTLSCDRHSKPFWLSLALFLFGLAGVGVTIWPYVVPPGITIWDAAAPERSQVFMLVGVAITMPLIIAYTAWAYWVFRGKVGDEGYH